jgi:hypothetical protein
MAIAGKQTINIGLPNESANSDSLYTAFTKINTNFNTLFANSSNIVSGDGITVTNNVANTVIAANIAAGTGISVSSANGAIVIASTGPSNAMGWSTAPASSNSAGSAGQIAYDTGGNLFICIAANTWAKFAGNLSW